MGSLFQFGAIPQSAINKPNGICGLNSDALVPLIRGGCNNNAYTTSKFLIYDGTKIASSAFSSGSFEPAIALGLTTQYWRGDKSWQLTPIQTAATSRYWGCDLSGNARGDYALDIQSYRADITKVASGEKAICYGYNNIASSKESVAIGIGNISTASGYYAAGRAVTIGIDNTVSGYIDQAVAIGIGNTASGNYSTAIGKNTTASENSSTAIGVSTTASGNSSTAIGVSTTASGNNSTAIGASSVARIDNTTNISSPLINRKDNGEGAGNEFSSYSGAEIVLLSKEVDFKSAATQTITLPSGAHFWLTEVGIIVTSINTMSVQPTISFGITGTNAKYVPATLSTLLTTQYKRQRFIIGDSALTNDGETSLTGTVNTGATATTMLGRFYFKGLLIEDE